VSIFRSLQGELIIASVVIVVVVLALAGGVFVNVRRGDQRQQELDHVTANATAIQNEFLLRQLRGESEDDLAAFVDQAARAYDVRALMIDLNGDVLADSAGELEGATIAFEASTVFEAPIVGGEPYVTIRPDDTSPAHDLVLVAPPRISPLRGGGMIAIPPIRYSLMLAVSEETLARAWLNLLPEMGLAAAIALPVAILLAFLIARYITSPLEKLTAASLQMASGSFDVDVAVERDDEIGRLSRAFSTMAQRVGETQTQMRALVANVSHDMKTPLTSILGFSQALRDETESEDDTRRMAAIIHEEAKRLNGRLNDLLYLAELESGQVVLQQEDVDLERMIERSVGRIAPEDERHGISLTVEAVGAPALRTDEQKLGLCSRTSSTTRASSRPTVVASTYAPARLMTVPGSRFRIPPADWSQKNSRACSSASTGGTMAPAAPGRPAPARACRSPATSPSSWAGAWTRR
jgi:HAMP domain-containing protein/type II secretory pathway pseudopilin PulG